MRNKEISRRDFVKMAGAGLAGLGLSGSSYLNDPLYEKLQFQDKPKKIVANSFSKVPSLGYFNISHDEINWQNISDGLDFSRTNVYRDGNLIDIIAGIKIDPEKNMFRVSSGYFENGGTQVCNIEKWQELTGATAMINSNQYMSNPSYCPCALIISDGKQIGPRFNKSSRGMFLAEPKDLSGKLKKADVLDFEYDSFDYKTTPYLQGVQHWPILLDRDGKVKAKETSWQANRTAVAKTKDNEILFLTTEGGYFTLYNLGRFLEESNQRADKGFNIHTAMNMDGGYEADMIIKSPSLEYLTYGNFETQGPENDISVLGAQVNIPGVIGVFPNH